MRFDRSNRSHLEQTRQISSIGIISSRRVAMESVGSEEGDDDDANLAEDRQQQSTIVVRLRQSLDQNGSDNESHLDSPDLRFDRSNGSHLEQTCWISSIGIISSRRAAIEFAGSEEGDDDDANPAEDRQQQSTVVVRLRQSLDRNG
ncbi:hypothetical protein ACLOJK_000198 [Asimina triloba]